MVAPLRHTLRIALGFGLVILGIVGLILPIMPGWIFLIPGLLILADYFPPIRRVVDFARRKFKDAEEGFRKSRATSDGTGQASGNDDRPADEPSSVPPAQGAP